MSNFYFYLRSTTFLSFFSFLSHMKLLIFMTLNTLMNFESSSVIFSIIFPPTQILNHLFLIFQLSYLIPHVSTRPHIPISTFAHLVCSKISLFLFFSSGNDDEWNGRNVVFEEMPFVYLSKRCIQVLLSLYLISCIRWCSTLYSCWNSMEEWQPGSCKVSLMF
jgi:hypothetical protein